MVLDGLEAEIYSSVGTSVRPNGCKRNKFKVHFVRYADDFIVTGSSEEVLTNIVKPIIVKFLSSRGLELSENKTKITNVYTGFNFLGQNIRKYPNGKLLIRPSKDNFKSVLIKIKQLVRWHWGDTPAMLIRSLNPVITGWTNYHRHVAAAKCFVDLDRFIWFLIWKWAKRRHAKKGHVWIAGKYFKRAGNSKWQFFGTFDKCVKIYLKHASDTHIMRHVLIVGKANPYCEQWDKYFRRRYAQSLAS